jgi:hypothetical protein
LRIACGVGVSFVGEGALESIRGGSAADEMMVLAALREEIERLDPRARAEVSGPAGNEQLHVRHDHETRNTVSLHYLWNQLRGVSGEAAAGTIERLARLCVADFFSGEVEGAESVMPVVRDRGYLDSPREQAFDPAYHDNAAYAISPHGHRYARSDERVMLEPVSHR